MRPRWPWLAAGLSLTGCSILATGVAACGARSELVDAQTTFAAGGSGGADPVDAGSDVPPDVADAGTGGMMEGCPGGPPDPAPTLLYSAGEEGGLYLASDATHLYWSHAKKLLKMSQCGGEVTVLAEDQPAIYMLAVDEEHLYWAQELNAGSLNRVPKGGGPVESLFDASGGQTEGVCLDATHAYVAVAHDIVDGRLQGIWRVAKDGSGAERLCAGEVTRAIAVDDDTVYFNKTGIPGSNGNQLLRVPKTGGEPTLVTLTLAQSEIAVDDEHVYWTSWGFTPALVMRIPKDEDGAVVDLVSDFEKAPLYLALDDAHVYWNSQEDDVIRYKPMSGGAISVLAADQPSTQDVEARNGWVFWLSRQDGGVWRAGKP